MLISVSERGELAFVRANRQKNCLNKCIFVHKVSIVNSFCIEIVIYFKISNTDKGNST